jgi:hypothetical protein
LIRGFLFKKLHRKGMPHHGIVICTYDPNAQALAARIAEAVSREASAGRWLASVVRPNPSPRSRKRRR